MSSIVTVAPVGTWALDPVHSSVGFEIEYLGGTFRGAFREVSGTLTSEAERVSLVGTALVASVDAKDENLAAHLQSPEFFDAERHPELRFEADDVSLEGESVTVDGRVTIKGVTQPVSVSGSIAAPLTDAYGRERLGLKLSTTVDRAAFGLDWNLPLPNGEPALADDVVVDAELFLVRAA